MNKYYVLLTNIGIAKLANATALNQPLKITHMAVGDSNGVVSHPDIKQTSLINECYRAQLNSLSRDETNHNQIIAEMVIPENIGGWYIREAGLLDEHGDLIAVANTPESYKPQLQEGSGRSQIIRMVLVISNTTSVELKIDSSVVLASRQYVEQLIKQHANSDNHPTATTSKKGMVILSNAVDSKSETTAATSASIQTAIAKSRQYSEQLIKQHANSDNHPMATTSKKGMVILSNAVDSKSETTAATSASIQIAIAKGYQYTEQLIKQHANSDNHPTATTSKKGMVILSNATTSDSGTTAATSKAVKAVADAVNKIVIPVNSVNGKKGTVVLTGNDIRPASIEYIYPVGNTGEITNNTVYEYPDPYDGQSVHYLPEVLYNNIWLYVGFIYGNSNSYGVRVMTVNSKIYITTGNNGLLEPRQKDTGIPQQFLPTSTQKTLPFRLKVIK